MLRRRKRKSFSGLKLFQRVCESLVSDGGGGDMMCYVIIDHARDKFAYGFLMASWVRFKGGSKSCFMIYLLDVALQKVNKFPDLGVRIHCGSQVLSFLHQCVLSQVI